MASNIAPSIFVRRVPTWLPLVVWCAVSTAQCRWRGVRRVQSFRALRSFPVSPGTWVTDNPNTSRDSTLCTQTRNSGVAGLRSLLPEMPRTLTESPHCGATFGQWPNQDPCRQRPPDRTEERWRVRQRPWASGDLDIHHVHERDNHGITLTSLCVTPSALDTCQHRNLSNTRTSG